MFFLVFSVLDIGEANVGIFPLYKPQKFRVFKKMMKVGRFVSSLEENKEKSNKELAQHLLIQKYMWSKMVKRMN